MARTLAKKTDLSPEQIDLIKKTVAVGTTDNELHLFLYVAKRTGLDPLVRQIHCVKREKNVKLTNGGWTKESVMTIQTGIDGFRVIAERSKKYLGQTKPEYEYDDQDNPISCTVGVFKKGFDQPIYATAFFDEYAQSYEKNGQKVYGPMWQRMPRLMIAKCAEALALRKAFPQDLSGIYTTEEMAQADSGPVVAAVTQEPQVSEADRKFDASLTASATPAVAPTPPAAPVSSEPKPASVPVKPISRGGQLMKDGMTGSTPPTASDRQKKFITDLAVSRLGADANDADDLIKKINAEMTTEFDTVDALTSHEASLVIEHLKAKPEVMAPAA